MDEKEALLSDARKVIIEDERLKVLYKAGKISEETYDVKHGEINARLAEIREQIAKIERKKKELKKPASVVKFNTSFLKRQNSASKMSDADEPLSDMGMVSVLSAAGIILGLFAFPSAVYSSIPPLPEPYLLPPDSELYIYLSVLLSQVFGGGVLLWLMAVIARVKDANQSKAILCTAQGVIISSAALSAAAYFSSGAGYVPLLEKIAYAAGILAYFLAIRSVLSAGRLTAALLALGAYAANYALAIAVMLSIIIFL